jgi:hypothetical protein
MTPRVKLRDVIEGMDLLSEDWQSYLDPETGEIVTVTDEARRLAEDEDVDLEDLADWEQESLAAARRVLESDRFLPLPDKFEINEWSIMEEFAEGRPNARQRGELLDSIHGRGAFRMFKSAIRRLGIEQEWYRFRDSEIEQIAKDWLEENGVEYE